MAWINQHPTCQCEKLCLCGGLLHSFQQMYVRVLRVVAPKHIFEWGPGLNTKLATEAGAFVTAVESLVKYVPRDIPQGRFSVHVVPETSSWYLNLYGEEDADLFFVDGRRRAECLQLVHANCRDNAVVCLHDAQRERYHKALRSFKHVHFIERGFAIASKSYEMLNRLIVGG